MTHDCQPHYSKTYKKYVFLINFCSICTNAFETPLRNALLLRGDFTYCKNDKSKISVCYMEVFYRITQFPLNFHTMFFRLKGVYLNYGETLSDLPAAIASVPNKYIERTMRLTDKRYAPLCEHTEKIGKITFV